MAVSFLSREAFLNSTRKIVFIIIASFLLLSSCKESDNNSENDEFASDSDESQINDCFEDIYGLGGESCPFLNKDDLVKRYIESIYASYEGVSFKVDEIMLLENGNSYETIPRGECGQKYKCGISFGNYDRALFKDSLIGKEITVFVKEGFYGSTSGEYMPRDVHVVRHKDGTLISVYGVGIVNESNENEWDDKVWPSELVPEVKAEQKVLPECEKVCQVIFSTESSEKPYYDQLVFPPIEFKVDGKEPVVVRSGEVVRSEGYEYFVKRSKKVHPDDPDQIIYELGKEYQFDFFIVNTEALK